MKLVRPICFTNSWRVWLPLLFLTTLPVLAEERLDLLETRTGTYTNVTITSKTADWIFILHAGGMGNVKIADLSKDAQIQLGYAKPEKPKATQETTPGMEALTELNLPPMAEVQQTWKAEGPGAALNLLSKANLLSAAQALWPVLGLFAVIYLFFCYCCQMICRKTHTSPGWLIWVPVLQLIPLLRAAGMSRLWLFAFFVPVLNLVAQIIWCVKIVQARGKGPLLVLWLVLPFTGPFAFLYLAFSSAAPVEIEREGPLVLETA